MSRTQESLQHFCNVHPLAFDLKRWIFHFSKSWAEEVFISFRRLLSSRRLHLFLIPSSFFHPSRHQIIFKLIFVAEIYILKSNKPNLSWKQQKTVKQF
jgi:hypothetical protein